MTITTYHVFSDGRDEFLSDYAEAVRLFETWAAEHGNVRLYQDDSDEDGETVDENCLRAVGDFPY
jgi:hypothetical protein